MQKKTIVRVLLLHLSFHTFWALLFLVSLLGVFILIPFIGLYVAFVLGFLGKSVLASTTTAIFLGYIVFSVTGFLSGWFISFFRPKSVWIPACISLFLTGVLLISATWIRYQYVGVSGLESILPLPTTTGRTDMDTFRWALKGESMGEVPPYFSGKSSIISLSEVQPSLRLLPKDFQLKDGPYVYCNLPPQVWNDLRKEVGISRCPVVWNTQPDSSSKRLVVSVDLKTDIFSDEFMDKQILDQMLGKMEEAVQKQTGDTNFKLQK